MPSTRPSASVVDLLEAAYRPELTSAAWTEGIADGAKALDLGPGAVVIMQRLVDAKLDGVAFTARGAEWLPELFAGLATEATEEMARLFWSRRVTTGSMRYILRGLDDAQTRVYWEHAKTFGVHDLWGLAAQDGSGVLLSIVWPARDAAVPVGFERWTRIATHLSTAMRLAERWRVAGGVRPEAILSPDGKLLHAEGLAASTATHDKLVDAVRGSERARGRERGNPEAAMSLWQALVAGRWSLVDQIESDGKRLVLALPNPPVGGAPWKLSERQQAIVRLVLDGAQNKEIAYALGIDIATVGTHLARALHKLRVNNRAELAVVAARAGMITQDAAARLATDAGYVAVPMAVACSKVLDELTQAQREVVALVAEGLSNQDIADRRETSVHTVRNQLTAIRARLGGIGRAELAAYGARRPQ